MEQALVERSFVRQQQKALGVGIEPADWVHTRRQTESGERPMACVVGLELGQDAVRLVKREEHAPAYRASAPLGLTSNLSIADAWVR
jgi:hypothetical protein